MKVKAKVLNDATTGNKVIMFEVNQKDVYKVMEMLKLAGFEVDYRKCGY